MKSKSFFGEIFIPIKITKVSIEYKNGIYVLRDDADQDLGYEFESSNQAFRFAKTMGYNMDAQTS